MVKQSARTAFRVRSGEVDLKGLDPAGTPIGPQSRAKAAKRLVEIGARLDPLQEALYAEGVGGGPRRVLLVLQGLDTAGKGGVIKHAGGLVDPAGLQIASFKKPTPEERAHDFLWRIRKQVPVPGRLGIFDRSHYEDVLVVRVESLVAESVWRARYDTINAFEAELVEQGVTLIKCFLHISPRAQAKRLFARLDEPGKRWKYNPGDVDTRAKWADYQLAYADVLERCNTDVAPWYAIPADHKWYRNWAVASLLLETLQGIDPGPPQPEIDIAAEKARIAATGPVV